MYIIYVICQELNWIAAFFATRILGSFKFIGKENIKGIPRPLMIISNHISLWDPMAIGSLFPFISKYIPMTFMAADEFFRNPILKAFFWLTNTVPANKGMGYDVSLKKPREALKNGRVFLIFPGGQRHSDGSIQKPRRGAAILAMEMPNLTILPVNIKTDEVAAILAEEVSKLA
jgi:1-acyl-sn-glycerol-3-phosphate acyltransferase